jgi:type IV pilus assembly protein PilB
MKASTGGLSLAAKNLGELLVRESLIDLKQLEEARREQRTSGSRFSAALIKLGYLDNQKLNEFLENQYGVKAVDLATFEIDPEALKMVPKETCLKHMAIPVSKFGNVLVVAFEDPSNVFARDDITFLTKCRIEVMVAPEHSVQAALERYYGGSTKNDYGRLVTELEGTAEAFVQSSSNGLDLNAINATDGPVVKFVNAVLSEAIASKASDIHIEPYEKRTRVRFRIDGRLLEKIQPPAGLSNAIVARIKIMSKLDITERRRPQDGRLKVLATRGDIDFRVSVLPTLFGEKVVMRLLDKANLQLDMTKLGFDDDDLLAFKKAIALPQGMVLITGPTGSGKTTTIYSALAELNTNERNISTVEDPVEFNLDGINQVQVNHDIKFGFSDALRSFLRQDPNIIMVGEIRDVETAEIAFKASSTGHLVVSTLHTNDAAATVVRLLDMGIAHFLIGSSINLIVAQRLVQKICEGCKAPFAVTKEVLVDLGVKPEEVDQYQIMRGTGCSICGGTGMKGRVAIYELMTMSHSVREAILERSTPSQIKRAALADGMRTLRGSALRKLKHGVTTIEQVLTVTMADN